MHVLDEWLLLRDVGEVRRVVGLAGVDGALLPSVDSPSLPVAGYDVRPTASSAALDSRALGVRLGAGGVVSHARCCGAATRASLAVHAPHVASAPAFSARTLAAELGSRAFARALVLVVPATGGTLDDVLGAATLATERLYIVTAGADLDDALTRRTPAPWTFLRRLLVDEGEYALPAEPLVRVPGHAAPDGPWHERLRTRQPTTTRVELHAVASARAFTRAPFRVHDEGTYVCSQRALVASLEPERVGDVLVTSSSSSSSSLSSGVPEQGIEHVAVVVPPSAARSSCARGGVFCSMMSRARIAEIAENESFAALTARIVALTYLDDAAERAHYPGTLYRASLLPEARSLVPVDTDEYEALGVTLAILAVRGNVRLEREYVARERAFVRARAGDYEAHVAAIEAALGTRAPLPPRTANEPTFLARLHNAAELMLAEFQLLE